jgi:hypothetical protein
MSFVDMLIFVGSVVETNYFHVGAAVIVSDIKDSNPHELASAIVI